MRGVCPGVAAFIALVGDQAVADDDEQSSFRGLVEQSTGEVAKGGTEPGVAARG
jgi:hypothetical protein